MNKRDRADYVTRYEARLKEFGYSPETLGWGKHGRQEIRFGVLAEGALADAKSSVLDVGCGFGDLYHFLTSHGWSGRYTGIDIVPGLLDVGRQRCAGIDLRLADITEPESDLGHHDYVIASGVINAALEVADNHAHITHLATRMAAHATRAVCIDFMNTYVDFQKPGSWHTDPGWMIGLARTLRRRFSLRCDYMPYESALFIYMDDRVNEQSVFAEFAAKLAHGGGGE